MAECSYARCLQERRLIKNELKRWSKDMLLSIGLERVAEELMGGRKWKHFQESLTRTHLNTDQLTATIEPYSAEAPKHSYSTSSSSSNNNNNNNSEQDHQQYNSILRNSLRTGIGKLQTEQQQSYQENHRQPEEDDDTPERRGRYEFEGRDGITTTTTAVEGTTTSHNQVVQEHNNNNNINNKNNTTLKLASHKLVNNITTITTTPPSQSPTRPEPVDWKPNEKCYFCVDGKLLTVNSQGELVAESGPAMSETDHAQRLDTDSDSSESTPVASGGRGGTRGGGGSGPLTDNNRFNFHELLTSRLRDLPAMTSIDQIPPQLAALQRINWLQLAQHQQQQQQQQQQHQQPGNSVTPTTSDTSAAAISPSRKDSPSPSDATGEQPLDLSSKPSPNSSISGDLKNLRSKSSRSTPVPPTVARRTYSEDDLNNAVQDIVNGKLGTRKAAVQYNVPRSTLRNKVYKLSIDAKRASGQTPPELLQLQQELDMDKELSDAEEGDDSNASSPQLDAQQHTLAEMTASTLRRLCENNGGSLSAPVGKQTPASPKPSALSAEANTSKRQSATPSSVTQPQPSPQPQLTPVVMDPITAVQALLYTLGGGLGPLQPKLDETLTVRDFFGALLLNPAVKELLTAMAPTPTTNADSNVMNNGKSNLVDQRLLLQQLQQQQTPSFSHRTLQNAGTPETTSSLDASEAYEDPASSILKIPSFKPGASTSSAAARAGGSPALCNNSSMNANAHRNGDSPHSAPSPRIDTSILAAAVAAAGGNSAASRQSNSISVISPPLLHHHQPHSPPTRSFGDTIVDSIHRTMSEQSNKDAHAAAAATMLGLGGTEVADRNADYKKPSISVVKNIGGTDTSRFGAAPNLLAAVGGSSHHHPHHQTHPAHLSHAHLSHHHQSQAHHLSRQEAAALAAGKGTRPKRGKYRNYDRDSLVEAVKAVQRGEMSVHRAGSYYGVPHSTLEYKVKERHLMRPRKREPKPQPGLDGPSSSTSSKANSVAGLNSMDKLKSGSSAATSAKLKNNTNNNGSAVAFPNSAPANGMKVPIFDPAFAAQLQYHQSQLFWPHAQTAPFNQLQMDLHRNAAAAVAQTAASSASSVAGAGGVNVEILKSHIQRCQEEAANSQLLGMKGPRDYPENLYEGSSANGSSSAFFEGIIRKTLNCDVPPPTSGSVSGGGALLDQLLVKKSVPPYANSRNSDYGMLTSTKRAASPLPLTEIKRERASPMTHSSDEDTSRSCTEDFHERNNNNNNSSSLSGNGGYTLAEEQRSLQRHRMRSRDCDSESEASTIKSELQHALHNHSNKMADLNGCAVTPKMETQPLPTPQPMEMGSTSILQEKLAQIKSEQEHEENL